MTTSRRIRFATFEVDFRSGELRKNGLRIRLQDQPLKVLALLTERAGEIVTRDELQEAVWSTDTFVDFETGLNTAIKKIREALGDTAEHPRFIETLPRRGYRFIAPVDVGAGLKPAPTVAVVSPPPTETAVRDRRNSRLRLVAPVAAVFVTTLAVLVALNVANLRDRFTTAIAARPSVFPPKIESIAVLPLENLTGDPQQEYFVDGLHDELITQLAQVGSLKVISRTSVMRYKKEKPPLSEIGRQLGVEGVLEGTVRREGDRLHVTAQLIAARDDRHLWARSYDRDMHEAAAVPGEVARAVAETLRLKLTPQERLLLGGAQPVDPAVYTAYLRGKYFNTKMTSEGHHRAIQFLQEAIDRDPGYAPAWAEMAASYEWLSGYGLLGKDLSKKEALAKASAALARAIELNPHLKQPHVVLLMMKLNDWDWEGAAREAEKIRELDPAIHGGSYFLIIRGRPDEAVLDARLAVERNPLAYSAHVILGWTNFMAWRFDESIKALKRADTLDPGNQTTHFELSWNYAKKGMFREAVGECDTALELLRRMKPEAVAAPDCGWVYALAGHRQKALEIAKAWEPTAAEENSFTDIAHIYDALGQRKIAFKFLERAYQAHHPWLPRQWNLPMVSEELRADPRFQELMRRTGIPWIHFPRRGESLASAGTKPAPQRQR